MRGLAGLLVLFWCLIAGATFAGTEVNLYCVSGVTSTGALIWTPAGATTASSAPCITTVVSTPGTASYTTSVVTLTAATSAQLLAAGTYKSVCFMNIGTANPFTFVDGAGPAVVGQGQALNPAASTGNQGGGYCYPVPPSTAIQAISTLGTTVAVTVGQ